MGKEKRVEQLGLPWVWRDQGQICGELSPAHGAAWEPEWQWETVRLQTDLTPHVRRGVGTILFHHVDLGANPSGHACQQVPGLAAPAPSCRPFRYLLGMAAYVYNFRCGLTGLRSSPSEVITEI